MTELQKSDATIIITIVDNRENQAAKDAATRLQEAKTDEEAQAAFEDFKKKYADLVRMRVSTPRPRV